MRVKILAAACSALLMCGLLRARVPTVTSAHTATIRVHKVLIVKAHGTFKFKPAILTIRRGQKVEWVNRTHQDHTATDNFKWTTATIRPGKHAVLTFPHRNVFKYQCTFHPFMKGKLTVR